MLPGRLLVAALLVLHVNALTSRGLARSATDAFESAVCLLGQCQGGEEGETHWDYRGGGVNWNIGQCCIGKDQSPLNVTAALAVVPDKKKLFHGYHRVENPITITNDGKVLTALMESHFGGIALGEHFPTMLTGRWDLWKMVVHTPSEHTFRGQTVPLELQLMHRRMGVTADPPPADHVAIVSIGFAPGPTVSGFLEALSQGGLPEVQGREALVNREPPAVLDFAELFKVPPRTAMSSALDGQFWNYFGSQTTPPCGLGVQWFVRQDPLSATSVQVNKFADAIHAVTPWGAGNLGNARKLQPPCGRTVMLRPTGDVTHLLDVHGRGPDSTFRKAVETAAGQQKQFEASMTTAAPFYDDCIAGLAEARVTLNAASKRAKMECGEVAVLKKDVEEAGGGVTRLAAGERLRSQVTMCKAAQQVVAGLEAQVEQDRKRCENLESKYGKS